ncbi:Contig_18, whole genome shotgun sequence [Tenacibaculum amylolyticum]
MWQRIFHSSLMRIIIGFIVIISTTVLTSILLELILPTELLSGNTKELLLNIIPVGLSVFAYIFLYTYYEKRSIVEFSFKRENAIQLGAGLLLGFALQALTILVIYIKGGYTITGINPISYIIQPFAAALFAGVVEEILFRGILFRIMEEKLGSYLSLIISGFIFGMVHLGNPNSTFMGGLAIAIEAGILLGVAYMYTRNLWFPIAIHFAWNFSQSAIFGANVSGISTNQTLITSETTGATWYTGGAFGPEGSIQAVLFSLIVASILLFYCHKQGKVVKF